MKCVMVMFDSLNRHMLPAYNDQAWLKTPNFQRLAERATTFDSSYVSSMPCMPARRELHTARPNFLHCGWGPLEPFDDSVPRQLSEAGVYTHLITDHYHYFEDGGGTYHTRYDSWEFYRGQEGDPAVGQVADPVPPPNRNAKQRRSDWLNRETWQSDADYPQTRTFDAGVRFLDRNHAQDRWMLQIECFDPHEPFTTDRRWRELYPSPDEPDQLFDWPPYGVCDRPPADVTDARHNYAALVSKCDDSLGRVLDKFDEHGLWDDTMLIVWTDHGYMLGEHGWWAKNVPPLYDEVAHTPFFVHDPRTPAAAGQRRASIVQPAIDLGPTMLKLFEQSPTPRMLGRDLAGVIADDTPVRDAAIFGYHGRAVNLVTDDHVYLREPKGVDGATLNHYTLMPWTMRGPKDLSDTELVEPLAFTRDTRVLRLGTGTGPGEHPDLLFDRRADPQQERPLDDPPTVAKLEKTMAALMARADAPAEQYVRMGLPQPVDTPAD